MKKKRARSIEAKGILFNNIISNGRALFLEQGSRGFSMRALAQSLNLTQGALYTYVKSKRELWFAIVSENLKVFEDQVKSLRDSNENNNIDLIEKIILLFFENIKTDPRLFQIMFTTSPPPAQRKGPIEENFTVNTINILEEILIESIKKKEIRIKDPSATALYLWSLIFGNAMLSNTDIFGLRDNLFGKKTNLEYYNFVLEQIREYTDSLKRRRFYR